MVGYNQGTGADGYRMWNPCINRVPRTRDTIWLKKMYHKTKKQGEKVINSEPNVGKIEVKEDIVDKIGTEQKEKDTSDVSEREGENQETTKIVTNLI